MAGLCRQESMSSRRPKVIARCLLMTTDPGDLVLDPTCGSGTTAFVAEQWGRRWITIDTSRVALALARARIMGAKFPFYLLADSPEGQRKEAEVTRTPPPETPTHDDIRQGFVYERVPHITLKSIANNAEIDVIWEARQPAVEAARAALNAALAGHPTPFKVDDRRPRRPVPRLPRAQARSRSPRASPPPPAGCMEWEIPREAPADWPEAARAPLAAFWAGAHRPPAGDRRLDRRPRRVRIPLRQALRGPQTHPRRRPLHGGKPLAPPRRRRRRERRADRRARRRPRPARPRIGSRILRRGHPREPPPRRRPPEGQGRPHRVHRR